MCDWTKARLPTPLDFVPLGGSLSEGPFLSIRGWEVTGLAVSSVLDGNACGA